ncbi:hypothetical protein NUK34_00575 [Kerstersia gyiorum]|uniref:hypothetical protein n=1 Tax=Kerstersia gyiorum TaxID=206506 RepID=UPI00214FE577|nr:hypothetical protein [Kerstersia gyiorum]MCR4157355.1 hypothetical protein [Kerstersia gyiorum]
MMQRASRENPAGMLTGKRVARMLQFTSGKAPVRVFRVIPLVVSARDTKFFSRKNAALQRILEISFCNQTLVGWIEFLRCTKNCFNIQPMDATDEAAR